MVGVLHFTFYVTNNNFYYIIVKNDVAGGSHYEVYSKIIGAGQGTPEWKLCRICGAYKPHQHYLYHRSSSARQDRVRKLFWFLGFGPFFLQAPKRYALAVITSAFKY